MRPSAPELAVGGLALALIWSQLPDDVRRDLEEGAADDLQEWLNQHPDVVQHLVNGSGGLLDGLWDGLTPAAPGGPLGVPLFTPDTESAAALLAGLYHDGSVHTEPTMLTVPSSGTAPADLAGLIHHLGEVNELSGADHPEHNGTIEIQTITAPDGSVSHVVYLPGTDDMATTPWSQDGDVRDLGTNLLLVSGQDNGYQHGILEAMAQAGIRAGQPVVLVGHSQGGMEAAAILAQSQAGTAAARPTRSPTWSPPVPRRRSSTAASRPGRTCSRWRTRATWCRCSTERTTPTRPSR